MVFLEAALVAAIGAVLAFTANGLSPRGLKLTRDFFPGTPRQEPPRAGTNTASAAAGSNAAIALLAAQLKEQGLQMVEGKDAARLFQDPGHELDTIVFVDARDEAHYEAGHIPGAYEFDHYHAEKYFAAVLPICQQAQQVIVYCNGGDCEDSKFAAIILRDAGISKEKLFIYAGGITEWQASGLPTEAGQRHRGNSSTGK